jgi:hypothetical protein
VATQSVQVKEITMKYKALNAFMLAGMLGVSSLSHAQGNINYASCSVDVHNELHLDGKSVTIISKEGQSAIMEPSNGLMVAGELISLTENQQQQLNSYRDSLNQTVPKVREVAQSGLALVNEIIDEISASFNNTDAFENVRTAVADFYTHLEQRYYKDGELVLMPDAFHQMYDNWQQDFADAREVFNREFFASGFSLLQEKLTSEEGVDFSALQKELSKLKTSIEVKLKEKSAEVAKQAEVYCDSMNQLAEEEKSLIESIPELKDYRLFEI